MNTLKLKLNPYKDINIASLDDKPLSPYSELNNYMKEPFLSWVSKLLEAAEREINDDYCLEVENRGLPYHFTEDNITDEPSYHSYEVDRDFGQLQDAINEYNNPALTAEENEFMRGEFQKEYDRNNWPSDEYTHEPGKTYYGDIAEAFDSGGGTQLELPMSVESLKELGMIHEV